MKKEYNSPITEVISVEYNIALAGSKVEIDKDHPGGTEQLSNKHRGQWGDVWGK